MKAFFVIPMLFGAALFAGQADGYWSTNTSTPGERAQWQTDHLTNFFNLSPMQQGTVLGILNQADTRIQSVRAQLKPLRETLRAEIKADQPNEINATLLQISPLQQQIESIRAVAAGQIYATVLTADQQARIKHGLGPLLRGAYGERPVS